MVKRENYGKEKNIESIEMSTFLGSNFGIKKKIFISG